MSYFNARTFQDPFEVVIERTRAALQKLHPLWD